MSTFIVSGSPREGMFSDRMADLLASLTNEDVIRLRSKRIAPCHACEYCHEINEGECIQRDDMVPLYKKFRQADTIAIFSPIYWWQVTAQTKLFIDRLYALGHEDWKDKKFIIVLNGAAADDDVEFTILENAFKEMIPYMGGKLYFLGVGTTDEEDYQKKINKVTEFLKDSLSD